MAYSKAFLFLGLSLSLVLLLSSQVFAHEVAEATQPWENTESDQMNGGTYMRRQRYDQPRMEDIDNNLQDSEFEWSSTGMMRHRGGSSVGVPRMEDDQDSELDWISPKMNNRGRFGTDISKMEDIENTSEVDNVEEDGTLSSFSRKTTPGMRQQGGASCCGRKPGYKGVPKMQDNGEETMEAEDIK